MSVANGKNGMKKEKKKIRIEMIKMRIITLLYNY